MRCKPSRKCFLINQMIWPIGLPTDKSYIVYHTRRITGFILRHQRKAKATFCKGHGDLCLTLAKFHLDLM